MKVIFLDIDGVLNKIVPYDGHARIDMFSDPYGIHPSLIKILNKTNNDGVKYVLSSSWRAVYTLEDMRKILSEAGFEGELVDMTPVMFGKGRGKEISAWIEEGTDVEAYAILDDMEIEGHGNRYVRVNGENGITEKEVDKVKDIFGW